MNELNDVQIDFIRSLGGDMKRVSEDKTETSFDGGDYFLHVRKVTDGFEAWIVDANLSMAVTLSVGPLLANVVIQAYHNAVQALRRINDRLEESL